MGKVTSISLLMAQRKEKLESCGKGHAGYRFKTDAQDRLLWWLGHKNQFTPAARENKPSFRRMKIFINTPGTNE